MSSVVSEVLESAVSERLQRIQTIKQDLDALAQRELEMRDLADQLSREITQLREAHLIERDHLERAAA